MNNFRTFVSYRFALRICSMMLRFDSTPQQIVFNISAKLRNTSFGVSGDANIYFLPIYGAQEGSSTITKSLLCFASPIVVR